MILPLALTTIEKIKAVPKEFWLWSGVVVVAIVGSVIAIRILKQSNKIILSILIAMGLSMLGFSWIYERNEPAFLTPAVDVIAQFMPTKGSYGNTQKQDPSAPKEKQHKK